MKASLRGLQKRFKSEKGQASIMIGMMMMTFIFFFAFVVNTGMLVNAKINLQNAADVAAYAGAATQARQLNQISYLNYEMRRQYKKFLFRYYVMGNMAQRQFPRTTGGDRNNYKWSPDGSSDLQVPSVCMVFNPKNNTCQVADVAAIKIVPSAPFDAIQETLRAQQLKLEEIRQNNCRGIGKTNLQTLIWWLFNTDPTLETIEKTLLGSGGAAGDPELAADLKKVRAIAQGLGLIPKEILLRQRIETLSDYVNEPAAVNVDIGKVTEFNNDSPDTASKERTIQAFLSAYHTLGEHTFSEGVQMDELLPAKALALKDIKVEFDVFGIDMGFKDPNDPTSTGCPPDPNAPITVTGDAQLRSCVQCPTPITLRGGGVPVGVYKDPEFLTYYAVRLKGKARLLFSPFGSLTLKAYSAAQPFGSRIGPALSSDDFLKEGKSDAVCNDLNRVKCIGKIPSLPVMDGNIDWGSRYILGNMFSKFAPEAGPGGSAGQVLSAIDAEAMDRAYQAAMVPNPWEKGKYNIIGDFSDGEGFVRFFEPTKRVYAFWAPLFSPAKASSGEKAEDKIKEMIERLTASSGDGTESAQSVANLFQNGAFKQALIDGLNAYVQKLRLGQGTEDDESFNIVKLSDPFHTRPRGGAALPQKITLPTDIFMSEAELVKTSWNDIKDQAIKGAGRTGYSVKFVSFSTLLNKPYPSDTQKGWTNDIVDSDAAEELPFISH